MRIEFVKFKSFPPFRDTALEFPKAAGDAVGEVQIFTGENGSGKTRLLCALTAALGNDMDLRKRHVFDDEHYLEVGFDNHGRFLLYQRRKKGGGNYLDLTPDAKANYLDEQPFVRTAHGSILGNSIFGAQAYRGATRVSDHEIEAMKSIDVRTPESHLSFDVNSMDGLICQSMANLKLGAAMELQSELPDEQCRATRIITRFEKSVSTITGRPFSFQVMPQPNVHLVARWGDRTMRLSTLPDGLRSIIGWLVACTAKLNSQYPDHLDPLDIPLILLLDEPETHLHPTWQRKIIPAAQLLFPNSQIFVATHSPFVISSVNDGFVHILKFDEDGNVIVQKPVPCSKGDSYIDAVEDVLGLTQWYDPETESLLNKFREVRKSVHDGETDIEQLEEMGKAIAARGDGLSQIIAREILQTRKNLGAQAK